MKYSAIAGLAVLLLLAFASSLRWFASLIHAQPRYIEALKKKEGRNILGRKSLY